MSISDELAIEGIVRARIKGNINRHKQVLSTKVLMWIIEDAATQNTSVCVSSIVLRPAVVKLHPKPINSHN